MAKGKGKMAVSGGPHKNHGPKRHMHFWCGAMIGDFAKAGVLGKYCDFESWQLAMAARGCKKVSYQEFQRFVVLSVEDKKEYFKNVKK